MTTSLRIILAATAVLMAVIGLAHAQNSPVYVVMYVDVMPNVTNSGAALLQHYRDESRKEDSNLRTIVLQEIAAATANANADTASYLAFLRSPAAKSVFEGYGFRFIAKPGS